MWPPEEDLVNAATGWSTNFFELMKVGERRLNLMRCFNGREGIGAEADKLPERVFEPIRHGPLEGERVKRDEFDQALRTYYAVLGWDEDSGLPRPAKLKELALERFVGDLP